MFRDSGRYEKFVVNPFDNGWGSLDDPPPRIRAEAFKDSAKPAITYNKPPSISFDRSINPYRGCMHGCFYYFAYPTHACLGISSRINFEGLAFAKEGAVERLEKEFNKPGYVVRQIARGGGLIARSNALYGQNFAAPTKPKEGQLSPLKKQACACYEPFVPDFSFENKVGGIVAGVDEVGRGPWAGPVVASAVILNKDDFPDGLDDSKKLTKRKREFLYEKIREAAAVGIGQATVEEIDALNILQASLLAMHRAIVELGNVPEAILVDGNKAPNCQQPVQCIVKGDSRSLSIAAASIIAKVTRDRIMQDLALTYTAYGWERNAGYGTAEHRDALSLVGVSPHHRKSFAPIRKLITQSILLTS